MAGQTAQKANPPTAIQGFREGSRWIHEKPGGDELAEWFSKNVTLHDGLDHKDYITGIVLIPQKERQKQTAPNGNIVDLERLTFTPYPTTGARIAYLRDWIAAEAATRDTKMRWEIVPDESLHRSGHLPGGFFPYNPKWTNDAGKEVTKPFVGCSMGLRVYESDIRSGEKGRLILAAPCGSKVVPTVGRYGADENALMKAQTGAIGRTLAFAGMLVIPGTGVATAEDVQESVAQGVPMSGTGPEQAALPVEETSEAPPAQAEAPVELRQQAAELIGSLQEFPEKLAEVHAWAREREMMSDEATALDVGGIPEPALRGAVRLLERKLADAQKPKDENRKRRKPPETGHPTDN